MQANEIHLLPEPQQLKRTGAGLALPQEICIGRTDGVLVKTAVDGLAQRLRDLGAAVTVSGAQSLREADVVLRVDAGAAPHAQGYTLDVTPRGVAVTGHDAAGLRHGIATLHQLLPAPSKTPRSLPAMHIKDWPDFPHRGFVLDVSRDKVPTLTTLKALIDLLAAWKLNQFQLYMEHTFAYAGHEIVWRDASPYTAADVREIDAYCRARGIELVPSQNSFGHFNRWLIHDEYQHLAECADGIEHPFSPCKEPFGLCPTDPASLDFLAALYDQLLPNFSSRLFNAGFDEAFDLGHGRSAHDCEQRTRERVYLDFLRKVHHLVSEREHRMQFWGDIILCRPELIPELPRDAIALEWGYEADHPFAEDCRHFAEAGLEFYVCPGTSSWNSLAGRTANVLDNQMNAARNGRTTGASGLLNTDWGDHGHPQPLPVSYLGALAGAAVAWNADSDLHALDITDLLDRHVFRDAAGVVGGVACALGDVYRLPGAIPWNASALFVLLYFPERTLAHETLAGLTVEGLHAALDAVDDAVAPLAAAQMDRSDADDVQAEFAWVAEMLRLACRVGLARLSLDDPDAPVAALPASTRAALTNRLHALIAQRRALWLRRNRPGGLVDACARMGRLADFLEATP